MAKQFTGIDGSLYVDSSKVARVSEWTFNATADTLETTSLGDFARDYIYGIQSFTGTATIFYYENDSGQIEGGNLLTDVIRTTQTPTDPTHSMDLRLSGGAAGQRTLRFDCALNNVEITAVTGEIIQSSISFTVCGPLTTATFT